MRFGDKPQIFISSRMQPELIDERRAIVDAIEGTGMAVAWYWERDGYAAGDTYMDVCLRQIATSDGLVLILGSDLTANVRREYEAAKRNGHQCYVFVKDLAHRDAQLARFLDRQRRSVTMRNFQNLSELRTHCIDALAAAWKNSIHAQRLPKRQTRTRSTKPPTAGDMT